MYFWTQEQMQSTKLDWLLCTMNQQLHTIISQNITLLHVSILSCHAQTACNQYLAQLHQYFVQWTNKRTQLFNKLSHCYMFRHYRVILRQPVINTLPSIPATFIRKEEQKICASQYKWDNSEYRVLFMPCPM